MMFGRRHAQSAIRNIHVQRRATAGRVWACPQVSLSRWRVVAERKVGVGKVRLGRCQVWSCTAKSEFFLMGLRAGLRIPSRVWAGRRGNKVGVAKCESDHARQSLSMMMAHVQVCVTRPIPKHCRSTSLIMHGQVWADVNRPSLNQPQLQNMLH